MQTKDIQALQTIIGAPEWISTQKADLELMDAEIVRTVNRWKDLTLKEAPDCTVTIGDIVVPISRYPEAVEKAYEAGREYDIRVATFGHAGDGNLHTEILARKGDEDAKRRAELVNEEIVRWAISVGGTATGEHGVGIGKRKFMALEHGASLEVMKQIKRLLDPNDILNPGKIFEES